MPKKWKIICTEIPWWCLEGFVLVHVLSNCTISHAYPQQQSATSGNHFPLWLMHTARDREGTWKTMGFYIMIYTVHTTRGLGQGQRPVVSIVPILVPVLVLVPVAYSVYEPLAIKMDTTKGICLGKSMIETWSWIYVMANIHCTGLGLWQWQAPGLERWVQKQLVPNPIPCPCPRVMCTVNAYYRYPSFLVLVPVPVLVPCNVYEPLDW